MLWEHEPQASVSTAFSSCCKDKLCRKIDIIPVLRAILDLMCEI